MFIYNEDHTITVRLTGGKWATFYATELDLHHFILTSEVRPTEYLREVGILQIEQIPAGPEI